MSNFRYFVQLSFKGTNFVGWQKQPNGKSVQSVLEYCLSTLLREEIEITGAGRTDAGVHSKFFIAHFDTLFEIKELENLKYKLNHFLSQDIAIQRIINVPQNYHSRFDAISRTYEYNIHSKKNPFLLEFSYFFEKTLNIEKMNEACKELFLFQDFTSFSKLHTDVKTNLCEIYDAEWQVFPDENLVFTIKANRFLRNMVRSIVGTMIEIGKNKLSIENFRKIIESKNRNNAGTSVPPQGLFLVNIEYPYPF